MRLFLSMLLMTSLLALTNGCGQSGPAPANPTSASNSNLADQSISQVAQKFLEAVRTGNSEVATAQLTPLAQERMRAADMDFELLSNETASYQIGAVDQISADEAGIDSVWVEPDANGNPQKEQWTLGLQRIDGRWYVRGILADMGPNQPMVPMDFENPDQIGAAPANTAGTTPPANNSVPQQATRPAAQDPFRQ